MGYLVTPGVLGLMLGPTLDEEYRTAIILLQGQYDIFYTSPVAPLFFALALLVIGLQILCTIRDNQAARETAATRKESAKGKRGR
jgi:putative tricarboxylic transport membrane protein